MKTALLAVSSLGLFACHPASAAARHPGRVTGRVTLSGEAPPPEPAPQVPRDKICAEGPSEPSLALGPGREVANAVVTLEAKGAHVEPVKDAVLDQKGCAYKPRVQVLPVGSEIALQNSDPVLHNVHSYAGDDTLFNVAEPLQGQRIKQKLDKPGLLRVGCDVHPWMRAWIDVVDTPYYALTGPDGRFSLEGVPPGTYTVSVWHERLAPATQKVTVPANGTATLNVKLSGK